MSQTQNILEASWGKDKFSRIILLIVPAVVFLPSSKVSSRPDFSIRNTPTVMAEKKIGLIYNYYMSTDIFGYEVTDN